MHVSMYQTKALHTFVSTAEFASGRVGLGTSVEKE